MPCRLPAPRALFHTTILLLAMALVACQEDPSESPGTTLTPIPASLPPEASPTPVPEIQPCIRASRGVRACTGGFKPRP